jgi:hypothetical protein
MTDQTLRSCRYLPWSVLAAVQAEMAEQKQRRTLRAALGALFEKYSRTLRKSF